VGNQVRDGQKLFLIKPCSLECENYRYTIRESRRQGNKIEWVRT
jgi:hypothetical protein